MHTKIKSNLIITLYGHEFISKSQLIMTINSKLKKSSLFHVCLQNLNLGACLQFY